MNGFLRKVILLILAQVAVERCPAIAAGIDPNRGIFLAVDPTVPGDNSFFSSNNTLSAFYVAPAGGGSSYVLGPLGINGIVLNIPWTMLNNDVTCSRSGGPPSCTLIAVNTNGTTTNIPISSGQWDSTQAAETAMSGSLSYIFAKVKQAVTDSDPSTNSLIKVEVNLVAGTWAPLLPDHNANRPDNSPNLVLGGPLQTSPMANPASLLTEMQTAASGVQHTGFANVLSSDSSNKNIYCVAVPDAWNSAYVIEYNSALNVLVKLASQALSRPVDIVSISGINEQGAEIGMYGDGFSQPATPGPTNPTATAPSPYTPEYVNSANCNTATGSFTNASQWQMEGYDPSKMEIAFASIAFNAMQLASLNPNGGSVRVAPMTSGGLPLVSYSVSGQPQETQSPLTNGNWVNQPCMAPISNQNGEAYHLFTSECGLVGNRYNIYVNGYSQGDDEVQVEKMIVDVLDANSNISNQAVSSFGFPQGAEQGISNNILTVTLPAAPSEQNVLPGFTVGETLTGTGIASGTTILGIDDSIPDASGDSTLTAANTKTKLTLSQSTTSTQTNSIVGASSSPSLLNAQNVIVLTTGLEGDSDVATLQSGPPCLIGQSGLTAEGVGGTNSYFQRNSIVGYQAETQNGMVPTDSNNGSILSLAFGMGAEHIEFHWKQVEASESSNGTVGSIALATEYITGGTNGNTTIPPMINGNPFYISASNNCE